MEGLQEHLEEFDVAERVLDALVVDLVALGIADPDEVVHARQEALGLRLQSGSGLGVGSG
jgi:hypothetical protein